MLDDEKCLCGSGRLYSMCCKPFSGQGIENYKKEIDSKNYIKAYYIAVAMLSDYLEDVRKHTNRILKDNPVIGRFVLHKDVNALSELADRIFHCIPKGNTDNWGERFEFIKGLVDAEDWKNECEYYQLLYYELNNDKGKFSEQIEAIVKNTKVDVHTDQRMLELLRSVILPSGQLTELLKLDDILIEKTDSSLMKLKYKFDKAIQLALVSDNTSAKKIADEVIPLWQLIYHGYILSNPSAETVNYCIKSPENRLRFYEYGGIPTIYYYSKFVSEEKRTNWMGAVDMVIDDTKKMQQSCERIVEMMQEYQIFAPRQMAFMQRHEKLAEGVYQTTYSDGYAVVCNYSDVEYHNGAMSVQPQQVQQIKMT